MAVQMKEKVLHLGSFPIKNGVTVPPGGLVTLDSNQQVILADQSTNVTAQAFAAFDDGAGASSLSRTGTAQLDVRATLYRQGIVQGASGMSSLTIGGVVYLGAAGAYTQSAPVSGSVQSVGEAIDTDTVAIAIAPFLAASGGGGGGPVSSSSHFLVSQTESSLPNSTVALPDTDPTLAAASDARIATQKAVKQYVDASSASLIEKTAVDLATTAALPAGSYDNGAAGVGATFTVTATGTLTVDSVLTILNMRILVKNQVDQTQNGVYKVTTAGAIGVQAVLTRATDSDTGAKLLDGLYGVTLGTVNTGLFYYLTNSAAPTIGTDNLVYSQFQTGVGNGNGISVAAPISKSGKVIGFTAMNSATGKTTPVDADLLIGGDSAAGFAPKKITFLQAWANYFKGKADALYQVILTGANFGTFLDGLTAKTTPVDADEIVLADSAATFAAKKVTGTNLKAYLKTYFDTLYDAAGAAAAVTRATLGANIYDIAFFVAGKPSNSQVILEFIATRSVVMPASLTGSQAKAGTASSATATFDIQVNGVSKGSMVFTSSATGTFTFSSQVTLAAGDVLTVIAPGSADANLADVRATFACTY